MKQRFFRCSHCGNIIAYAKSSGVPVFCCGEKMQEIIPGSTDASKEKHVPVYKIDGNVLTVTVGEIAHPMSPEHYIEWISVETKHGNQRVELSPNAEPEAKFALVCGDEVIAVYAYCNTHGLFVA